MRTQCRLDKPSRLPFNRSVEDFKEPELISARGQSWSSGEAAGLFSSC